MTRGSVGETIINTIGGTFYRLAKQTLPSKMYKAEVKQEIDSMQLDTWYPLEFHAVELDTTKVQRKQLCYKPDKLDFWWAMEQEPMTMQWRVVGQNNSPTHFQIQCNDKLIYQKCLQSI